jgi:hypothetical protein
MTRIKRFGRFGAVAAVLTLAASLLPAATGSAVAAPSVQSQLAQVRAATAAFHDTTAANNAGYFLADLPCFDSPAGGMGVHFINGFYLNQAPDLTHPAALVFEPRATGPKLVAVEYVMPGSPNDTPPVLLGQPFTYLDSLQVWKLHAWIWQPNPSGMFADFNPDIQKCPTT